GKKRGKKKELTKAEVRHNAAKKAWETRNQNGWTPKPRRPRLTTNIIEIDEKKNPKKSKSKKELTPAQKAAETRRKNREAEESKKSKKKGKN
ncbi:MAG: hypothetical protein OEY30_01870, partial [Candidatus Bathyarchaeota archaeon]|nr:hypothetical protein [Candidatus Bathyarchaeota archaeon]